MLEQVVQGRSDGGIAENLDITQSTVKFHIRGLMRKFDVRNQTEMAYAATRNGVV